MAIDLFRRTPGPPSTTQTADAVIVTAAAAQALLDVTEERFGGQDDAERLEQWEQIASLARLDVFQAAGMVIAQLELSGDEARTRLRAYAFANHQTASEVAQLILSRRLRLEQWTDGPTDV
jgi:AmiR/NasT family two-component response regulator